MTDRDDLAALIVRALDDQDGYGLTIEDHPDLTGVTIDGMYNFQEIADAILADYDVTRKRPPVGSVWLTLGNTITSVTTGGPSVTRILAEPFVVPEAGWYRINPDTMRMERATNHLSAPRARDACDCGRVDCDCESGDCDCVSPV
jgi:hypothetical protein